MTGDNFLNITKQTTSDSNKYYPQLQVVGTTIYYVWYEDYYIWTATSNLDGTEFTPTKQTSSSADRLDLQFQVVGTTIYYVFIKGDTTQYQIWIATSDLDGTNFNLTKITVSAFDKYEPQFQVVGTKIYYIWLEYDVDYNFQIWTATSNIDGTEPTSTKQTANVFSKEHQRLQVMGTTIYYVWNEYDVNWYNQIWTATSNPESLMVSYANITGKSSFRSTGASVSGGIACGRGKKRR